VVPELELSGRALEFAREDWHAAVTALAAGWVEALTADLVEDDAQDAEAAPEAEAVGEAEVAPEAEAAPEARPAAEAEAEPEAAAAAEPQTEPAVRPEVADRQSSADPDAISEDPLEPIWQGRYEKNRWLPVLAALTLFLLIKRRRRHRTDPPGADSSFRME
jgi:hypothetical protein